MWHATYLSISSVPLYPVFQQWQLLTRWRRWGKRSYFHFITKTLWKIPEVQNVILYIQFFWRIQGNWIPTRICELYILNDAVQLRKMHDLLWACSLLKEKAELCHTHMDINEFFNMNHYRYITKNEWLQWTKAQLS